MLAVDGLALLWIYLWVPPSPSLRMDRVTIREKEELEKREEQLETERKRQEELRKRESQRVREGGSKGREF